MKNFQKSSTVVWAVIVIVLVVLVRSGIYVFNSGDSCRITDSSGKTTFRNPCPESKADYTFNASDNTDLGRVQQATKDQVSKYLSTAPAGFLKPTTIPSGYKPQPHPSLFETDSATYYYTTNKGVPADKNITFEENGSSHGMYGNYDQYIAYISKDVNTKLVKDFNYNGINGKIFTYTSNSNPNYSLTYPYEGRLLRITATNDSDITPDTLIDLLKTMTVSK